MRLDTRVAGSPPGSLAAVSAWGRPSVRAPAPLLMPRRGIDAAIAHAVKPGPLRSSGQAGAPDHHPDDDRDGDALEPATPAELTIDRSRRPCECRAATNRRGEMKRVLTLIACVLPLALATAATASPAMHITEDPTGDVFVCEGGETYTITGGTLRVTLHEDENAAGGFNFTATIVPRRVTAVNSDGDEFRAVGAVWFGATGNAA